jgi:hypothetical protein
MTCARRRVPVNPRFPTGTDIAASALLRCAVERDLTDVSNDKTVIRLEHRKRILRTHQFGDRCRAARAGSAFEQGVAAHRFSPK